MIVTVKLHISTFPLASVALTNTVVSPIGNSDPDGVLSPTVTFCPELSMGIIADQYTMPLGLPGRVLFVLFDGHVNCGGSLSSIKT